MATNQTSDRNGHWWVAAGLAFTLAAALAIRGFGLAWWWPAVVAATGTAMLALVGWRRPAAIPACTLIGLALVGAATWVCWVVTYGWGQIPIALLCSGSIAVTIASLLLPSGGLGDWVVDESDPDDRRPRVVRDREEKLRRATKQPIVVTRVEPWKERPKDGERIYCDLPDGCRLETIKGYAQEIQGKLKLKHGCVVTVLDGEDHQGQFVLDVMLRDSFTQDVPADLDTTPLSILDAFPIGRNARGVWRSICLRIESVIVGGSPGSGKTTFLRRLIMYLARCTDAVVWVIDLNGGGVAEPFVTPWARGEATAPAVDWVAHDLPEAAVMVTVARELLKDRKTAPWSIRLKHLHNTNVLPVSAKLPAVVVLGDEGAEIEKALGLLGTLVSEGITTIGQIGRGEAGRVVHSILRGVADCVDKNLRANAANRVCHRMIEHDEYAHILDRRPPRIKLRHPGQFWAAITPPGTADEEHPDLELLRGVDVTPQMAVAHTIATAHLRPTLDQRAQQVAAAITLWDVLGKDPREVDRVITDHPAMRDVEAGRAYSGRWERFEAKLAAMRGEVVEPARQQRPVEPDAVDLDLSELENATAQIRDSFANPEPDPDADGGERSVESGDDPTDTASSPRTRELIEQILRDAYPRSLESREIGQELLARGSGVSRQTRHAQLRVLLDASVVGRDGSRYVYRPRTGEAAAMRVPQ
jgi:hypothetical protein